MALPKDDLIKIIELLIDYFPSQTFLCKMLLLLYMR